MASKLGYPKKNARLDPERGRKKINEGGRKRES
jgi:hypothetical protein